MRQELIRRLDTSSTAVARRLAFVGVVGMLAIGILTTLDVIVFRAVLNAPIPGSNELLQTVFGVAIAAVLASGFAERANLNVDLLKDWMSPRLAAWLETAGHLVFLILTVLLAWRVGAQAEASMALARETVVLQLPLTPFLWAETGLIAMCVPIQLVVFLSNLETALSTRASEGARASSDRRYWLIAVALLVGAVAVALSVDAAVAAMMPTLSEAPTLVSILFFALLWVLILLLVPVAAAMIVIGVVGTAILIGLPKALNVLGSETVGLITNPELALIPLFMMMGAFASISGMASDVYRLAHAALGFQRGGVALATIAGCAGFGALTGSSVATAATIGAVALPEMRKRGYSIELAAGCVAAGGTLGQLVPPSTAIVLYAILVEESIGKLYIAVLIPGVLSVIMYMIAIAVVVRIKPEAAPGRDPFDVRELWRALRRSLAVFVLFVLVIGGIYSGIFTVTEAAAVGAVLTCLVALARGKLGHGKLWTLVGETTRSVTMIYLMIIGALLVSFFMESSGLPVALTDAISTSGLPPLAIIYILVIAYIVLGTALDSFTIMIVTAPIVAPLIVHLGYDPIWWGIMMVVLCELGVVSPPFGLNLFILKSLDVDVTIAAVFRGVMPFVAADCVKVVILIHLPILVLWLPQAMSR